MGPEAIDLFDPADSTGGTANNIYFYMSTLSKEPFCKN